MSHTKILPVERSFEKRMIPYDYMAALCRSVDLILIQREATDRFKIIGQQPWRGFAQQVIYIYFIFYEDWRNRPLHGGRYPYVYVDGYREVLGAALYHLFSVLSVLDTVS